MGEVPFLGSITCPGSVGLISAGWSLIQHPKSLPGSFYCFYLSALITTFN